MKKILFILKGSLDNAVPIMSIAQNFNAEKKQVSIICGTANNTLQKELKEIGIEICSLNIEEPKSNGLIKKIETIKYWLIFRNKIRNKLKEETFDYLYISTADTAISLRNLFEKKYKYFLHLRELYDQYPLYMKLLKYPAQNAEKVIVPEENRAYLYSIFLKLNNIPTVIPNKPFYHPRTPKMDISFLNKDIQTKIKSKKNIIYQGPLHKERDLSELVKISIDLHDYNIILIGKDHNMLQAYLSMNLDIIYIPFLRPPLHLNITSWGDIGIITYDYNSLNTIYCAPNKVWEFSGFGIPILANQNPGIKYLIEAANIGISKNFNDGKELLEGIKQIEIESDEISKRSVLFFDTYNAENTNTLIK